MVRLFVRFLGLLLLAGAFAAFVVDAARSIAASRVILAQIGPTWMAIHPASLAAVEQLLENRVTPEVGGWVADLFRTVVIALPASIAFAVAGFVLLLLGAARRTRVPAQA